MHLYGEQLHRERMDEVTNVLLIQYPPSVYVDRKMLHDEMIVFGQIEKIECFPLQHYALVDFRSIHDAQHAKESLQGRLFRDPRIHIRFAPQAGIPPPGYGGPRADMLANVPPFGLPEGIAPPEHRGPRPDMFSNVPPSGLPHPTPASRFPGNANVIPGPTRMTRPYSQNFAPHQLMYGGNTQNYPHGNLNNNVASHIGQISPFAPHMRPPFLPRPALWNNFDMRGPRGLSTNVFPPAAPISATSSSVGSSRGPFATGSSYRPVVPGLQSFDSGCFWRGLISKHGIHVCLARCVRIAKGIESPLPAIVNCSKMARFEALEEYRACSVGFNIDIVYFVPDSEEEFVKYTGFLHYLSSKNLAGVVSLEDGNELFLVPTSDFLSKVFNISGPERIFGIVFKDLQQSANATMHHSRETVSSLPFSYVNDWQQESPSQRSYDFTTHYQGARISQRTLHEPLLTHPGHARHLVGSTDDGNAFRGHASNHGATAQSEISCRPELLPTLASPVPENISPSTAVPVTTPMPVISSLSQYSFPASVMRGAAGQPKEWTQEVVYPSQHLGHIWSNQVPQVSEITAFPSMPLGSSYFAQPVVGGTQFQGHNRNIHQASDFSNLSSNVHAMTYPSESYRFGAYIGSGNNNSVSQLVQHQQNSTISYAHEQNGHVPESQRVMHLVADEMSTNSSAGVQQLQTALSSSGEGTSEFDADKNQHIQSALQLAARLLHQIKQKEHVTGQAKQEIGSQHLTCPRDSDFSKLSANAHAMTYPNEELLAPQSNVSFNSVAHIYSGNNNSTSQLVQRQQNPISHANEQNGHVPQPERVMPSAADELNTDSSTGMQQLQPALSVSGGGTSEGDADKNQRIQSALQLAARLLLQIKKKERETGQAKQEIDD